MTWSGELNEKKKKNSRRIVREKGRQLHVLPCGMQPRASQTVNLLTPLLGEHGLLYRQVGVNNLTAPPPTTI